MSNTLRHSLNIVRQPIRCRDGSLPGELDALRKKVLGGGSKVLKGVRERCDTHTDALSQRVISKSKLVNEEPQVSCTVKKLE